MGASVALLLHGNFQNFMARYLHDHTPRLCLNLNNHFRYQDLLLKLPSATVISKLYRSYSGCLKVLHQCSPIVHLGKKPTTRTI